MAFPLPPARRHFLDVSASKVSSMIDDNINQQLISATPAPAETTHRFKRVPQHGRVRATVYGILGFLDRIFVSDEDIAILMSSGLKKGE